MSALDEIKDELMSDYNMEEPDKYTLFDELVLIFIGITYILVISFAFYYGIAYLLYFRSGNWEQMRTAILSSSFAIGSVSVILVGMRGSAGRLIFLASAFRSAWTGKKMESGAMTFYQDFVFGIKWDTIAFYGSLFVFLFTYFMT